jgi:hypothetical protein
MLQSSIHALFAPSAKEAASRMLPPLLPSYWHTSAQQQVIQHPHTGVVHQSAAYSNNGLSDGSQTVWQISISSSSSRSSNPLMSSRLQPDMPSLASSRCITTSAAAAAADTASKFLQAGDLQQLQEQVQQALQDTTTTTSFSAADAAAAYSAATKLAGKQLAAAAPVLQLLAPAWAAALSAATIQDASNALQCWSKLGYTDAQLWGSTLRAVPGLCSAADGQELADIALALAAAAEEAEEVLRAVTHQLVSMLTVAAGGNAAGAAAAAAAAAGEGSSGKAVTMTHVAMLRYANEVFEATGSSSA